MPRTLAQVRTDVRTALNESTARFWSDAQLNVWINEACRDISRRAECFLNVSTQGVTAGFQDLNALADTIRIHRIEFKLNSQTYPLEARSLAEMDQYWGVQQTVTSGIPRYWTTRGAPPALVIRMWPVPAANGFVDIHYYRYSADVSADGVNVDIPEGWFDLITDYAEYRAKRRDNDPTWKDSKDIYEEKLNNFIEVSRDFKDEAGSIVTAGGATVPAWLYGGGW